jgi:hypothetical protein
MRSSSGGVVIEIDILFDFIKYTVTFNLLISHYFRRIKRNKITSINLILHGNGSRSRTNIIHNSAKWVIHFLKIKYQYHKFYRIDFSMDSSDVQKVELLENGVSLVATLKWP